MRPGPLLALDVEKIIAEDCISMSKMGFMQSMDAIVPKIRDFEDKTKSTRRASAAKSESGSFARVCRTSSTSWRSSPAVLPLVDEKTGQRTSSWERDWAAAGIVPFLRAVLDSIDVKAAEAFKALRMRPRSLPAPATCPLTHPCAQAACQNH